MAPVMARMATAQHGVWDRTSWVPMSPLSPAWEALGPRGPQSQLGHPGAHAEAGLTQPHVSLGVQVPPSTVMWAAGLRVSQCSQPFRRASVCLLNQ